MENILAWWFFSIIRVEERQFARDVKRLSNNGLSDISKEVSVIALVRAPYSFLRRLEKRSLMMRSTALFVRRCRVVKLREGHLIILECWFECTRWVICWDWSYTRLITLRNLLIFEQPRCTTIWFFIIGG